MNTLNKICTGLAIIFVVSLLLLVAEILYVLYRRRRFQNIEFSTESSTFHPPPPKELLYYFCWKNQISTRIEPSETESAANSSTDHAQTQTASFNGEYADVDEILKRHAMYGPSRVLFTIKEEEKEEMESVEREESVKTVSLYVINVEVDDTTPFATPCASPDFYCTPSPSPLRDEICLLHPNGVVLNK